METPEAVDRVIRDRKTQKVLADEQAPFPVDADRSVVEDLILSAGWAPFHRPAADVHRGALASIVPWRFHVLDAPACRALLAALQRRGQEYGKIPGMLAAADALIQATWLPNPSAAPAPGLFDPTVENMEHIAAASAAIQNLLLAATARAIPTYWSSGGVLRSPDVFAWLGIPDREILLGAVFLFPHNTDGATVLPSKLRDKRGAVHDWARWTHPEETRKPG